MDRRFRKPAPNRSNQISAALAAKLVGQPAAIGAIVPALQMFQAGLAPEGRPAGVFLLLGPTGTGKTRTVEALAEVLHGSAKKMLKIDCGEFQMEHEVAKLIGAPPGYLGHRETQPLLTQQRVNAAASEGNDVSIILFDEIEKAAGSLARLLLGILDKAVLRLGDNNSVNFEKCLIFLTSNLGAREMNEQLHPGFGFEGMTGPKDDGCSAKLEGIAMRAVRRKFSPEFVNRIDSIVTYQPLTAAALAAILDQQIDIIQEHINKRLGGRAFQLEIPQRSRKHLLDVGTSQEFGARELRRTLQRRVLQPLASMLADGRIRPGASVRPELNEEAGSFRWRIKSVTRLRPAA